MTSVQRLLALISIVGAGCQHSASSREESVPIIGPAFSGMVRDSITPISNASVALYKGSELVGRATTDKAGRFTFGPRPSDDYRIAVSSPAYTPCMLDVSFWPPQRDVLIGVTPTRDSQSVSDEQPSRRRYCSCRIPLNRPGIANSSKMRPVLSPPSASRATLVVDVVDLEAQEGVSEAQVVLSPKSGQEKLGAMTDGTGRAVFSDIRPGTYTVRARRIGFSANQAEIVTIASKLDSMVLPFKWDMSASCVLVRTGP